MSMPIAFSVLGEDFFYVLFFNGVLIRTLLCFNVIVISAFGNTCKFK